MSGSGCFLKKPDPDSSWPVQYDPCPKGWHVPSKLEARALATKVNEEQLVYESSNYLTTVAGNKEEELLYILRCGYVTIYNPNFGMSSNGTGCFFTSAWEAPYLNLSNKSVSDTDIIDCTVPNIDLDIQKGPSGSGYFIHCVQDTP